MRGAFLPPPRLPPPDSSDGWWLDSAFAALLNSRECAHVLLTRSYFDIFCGRLLLSKLLGYVTMFGAAIFKVPVIMNILKGRTGAGLDPSALYMETSSLVSLVCYNFRMGNDFSTYGDNAAAVVQNALIIVMVLHFGFDGKPSGLGHIFTVCSLYGALLWALLFCPEQYYSYCVIFSMTLSTVSKVPQIIRNYSSRCIGVQSWLTQLTVLLGVSAKLFICLTETADDLYLTVGLACIVVLNSVLLLQSIAYADKPLAADSERRRN